VRALVAILVVLSLAGAYAAGRYGRVSGPDLSTLESFRAALDDWDLLARSYRFNGFLQTLNADELVPALEALEAKRDWLAKEEVQNFLFAWARFDPPGALDWALSQNKYRRKTTVPAVMYSWGFHDPSAAQSALETLEESLVEEAAAQMIAGWTHGGDRAGAFSYVAAQPAGTARQKSLGALAAALAREGAESLIQWVDAIPISEAAGYRRAAFQHAAEALARVDPVRASRWIETHLESDYSGPALNAVALRWTEQDPEAALLWLSGLPASGTRAQALQKGVERWLKWDPKGAEAWLISVTPAEGLDQAVRTLVKRYARAEPSRAIGWAQRIQDPMTRELVTTGVGRTWFRRDPDAAKAWLSESQLATSVQQAILQAPTPSDVEDDGRAEPVVADDEAA
jgi:hypothetical protein